MHSISQMTASALKTQQLVQQQFQAVRSLDNNPLFDQDPEPGSVKVQIDSWRPPTAISEDQTWEKPVSLTASARFSSEGTPLEMNLKTSRANDYLPNGEMDAPVIENTYSIAVEGQNTLYSKEYYGPTAYGEFESSSSQTAIIETSSGTLVDFRGHGH